MANTIGWGQAAVNNTIDWGKGKTNNTIGWGTIYSSSPYGDTDLIGTPAGDADANAFIAAAAITNPTQKSAIETLVVDLKGYGIWSKMKAIYPFVGGTASAHKFNLRNPVDSDSAFRLVFNGGWVHSSNGALPNGVNGFADTKLLPSAVQTLSSNSIGYYVRTLNTSTYPDPIQMGAFESTYQASLLLNTSSTIASRVNGNDISGVISSGIGFFSVSKTSQSVTSVYKNNTLVASGDSNGSLPQLNNILIGNMGISGVAYSNGWVNNQFAFSFIGDGLTDTQAANYYTAVQAFQTTLGRDVGVPIVSDSDAQAFLNAAVIENQTQANAVNTLVTDLKGYGIWSKMKALYPFVGGTASAHKFNLKNPLDTNAAFRLVFSGGWVHSSTGAKPNGVNGFADSYLVPSTTLQLNSTHISGYIRTDTASGGIFGCYNAGVTNGLYTNPKFSSGLQESRNNSGSGGNVVNTDSRGFWINTRIVSTQYKIFKNNTTNQTSNTNTTGLCTVSAYVGAININGTPEYQNREVAFSSIGDGLTDTEAANYYTAVQTFQTSLSRNV
jgi:hypothetical protein